MDIGDATSFLTPVFQYPCRAPEWIERCVGLPRALLQLCPFFPSGCPRANCLQVPPWLDQPPVTILGLEPACFMKNCPSEVIFLLVLPSSLTFPLLLLWGHRCYHQLQRHKPKPPEHDAGGGWLCAEPLMLAPLTNET